MVAKDKDKVIPTTGIVLQHVTKRFGGMAAIEDVSLVIEEGIIHSIIGPNGAGKTTLFNLICGNLSCTDGQVWFYGNDITLAPIYERVRMGLARTFQITNLFLDFTLGETVMLTKAPRRLSARSLRLDRKELSSAEPLLERFGLADKWEVKVKNLSHGEQRQIEVILGLVLYPKVLLLDEPTSGLSPAETFQMLDMIREVGKETTVVMIEHDLDVVFGLSDKITVLNYGRVICEGNKETVKKDPEVQKAYLGGKI